MKFKWKIQTFNGLEREIFQYNRVENYQTWKQIAFYDRNGNSLKHYHNPGTTNFHWNCGLRNGASCFEFKFEYKIDLYGTNTNAKTVAIYDYAVNRDPLKSTYKICISGWLNDLTRRNWQGGRLFRMIEICSVGGDRKETDIPWKPVWSEMSQTIAYFMLPSKPES